MIAEFPKWFEERLDKSSSVKRLIVGIVKDVYEFKKVIIVVTFFLFLEEPIGSYHSHFDLNNVRFSLLLCETLPKII